MLFCECCKQGYKDGVYARTKLSVGWFELSLNRTYNMCEYCIRNKTDELKCFVSSFNDKNYIIGIDLGRK